MRLAIGTKPLPGEPDGRRFYDAKTVEELSLFDMLTLERESKALGRVLTLGEINGMEKSVQDAIAAAGQGLSGTAAAAARREAAESHPDSPWLFAVMLWASQRAAGDKVSFEDAISVPMSQVEAIADPGEVETDPTRRRSGSSAGGGNRQRTRGGTPSAPATSNDSSTPA